MDRPIACVQKLGPELPHGAPATLEGECSDVRTTTSIPTTTRILETSASCMPQSRSACSLSFPSGLKAMRRMLLDLQEQAVLGRPPGKLVVEAVAAGSFYLPDPGFMSDDHNKPCVLWSEFACPTNGDSHDGIRWLRVDMRVRRSN